MYCVGFLYAARRKGLTAEMRLQEQATGLLRLDHAVAPGVELWVGDLQLRMSQQVVHTAAHTLVETHGGLEAGNVAL